MVRYAPLSDRLQAGNGMNFYAVGLLTLGLSSLIAALNFIVTMLRRRRA